MLRRHVQAIREACNNKETDSYTFRNDLASCASFFKWIKIKIHWSELPLDGQEATVRNRDASDDDEVQDGVIGDGLKFEPLLKWRLKTPSSAHQ
ncbi:hypothetical protein Tco_0506310 [Tanacetum coccineum]